MKTIKRFYNLAKPYLKWIILIILLTILENALSASRPVIVKTIIDQFMQNKVLEKSIEILGKSFVTNAVYIGLLYITIVLLENIIDFIVVKFTAHVGENIISDLSYMQLYLRQLDSFVKTPMYLFMTKHLLESYMFVLQVIQMI